MLKLSPGRIPSVTGISSVIWLFTFSVVSLVSALLLFYRACTQRFVEFSGFLSISCLMINMPYVVEQLSRYPCCSSQRPMVCTIRCDSIFVNSLTVLLNRLILLQLIGFFVSLLCMGIVVLFLHSFSIVAG